MERQRLRDISGKRLLLSLAGVSVLSAATSAQTIDVNSAEMYGDAFAFTLRPPGAPCIKTDFVPAGAPRLFLPDGAGFANRIRAVCDTKIVKCRLAGYADGWVRIKGAGTQTVEITWGMWTWVYNNCLEGYGGGGPYIAIGDLFPFQATMSYQVNGAGGAAVPVNFDWNNWSNAYCESEAGSEDLSGITGTFLTLNGADLFAGGGFNFDIPISANVFAIISGANNGSVGVIGGLPFGIAVSGEPISAITNPGKGPGDEDVAGAAQGGRLVISLGPIPGGCPPSTLEFSVDIGSDAELSDPIGDGDERLDPGDMYQWFGPAYAVPTSGLVDDTFIFGFDHDPNPAIPTGAITCTGLPVDPPLLQSMFDLDGSDRIDLDLTTILVFPILRSDLPVSDCIYPPDNIQVSLDDDQEEHYAGTGFFCEVPTTSPSPYAGDIWGQVSTSTEVLSVLTVPGFPPLALGPVIPILDEATLHGALAPSPPDAVSDNVDDDVDALDAIPDTGQPPLLECPFWCFSADHEAISTLALDPGDIYCVDTSIAGSVPTLVVDDVVNLGLSDDTDVDAFEFAWVLNPDNNAENLALLFSVDDDDPLTAPDESGGLDPAMIYVSFLDGSSAPFLDAPLPDDVDAISVSCEIIQPIVQGACCFLGNGCANALTPTDCANLLGVFMGNGTTCLDVDCASIIGACCLPGGVCTDTIEPDCAQQNGDFLGAGTSCAVDICTPCCLPTSRCVMVGSAADCATLQGVAGAPGLSCADVDCTFGACCWGCDSYPFGNPQVCQEVSRTDCCALQGLFAGHGSTCAIFDCTTICRGDLDGNSTTDVFDFAVLAANFAGAFPAITGRCDGDLNCDGTVDIFDFGIFSSNFGCTSPVVPDQCCGP